MKKNIIIGALSALLVIGGAAAAFAAVDSSKLDEIKNLTGQMFGIQKQIVDKQAEAGMLTQDQADKIKKAIDQRQQKSDEAITNGKVPGVGFGKGKMRGMNPNNSAPMTEEQVKAWSEKMQTALNAKAEGLKKTGKLTDEQIKVWLEAVQAQLKVQEDAMKNGVVLPGGFGMIGGKGNCGPGCTTPSYGVPNQDGKATPQSQASPTTNPSST